jgi:hypothetical protein
MNGDAGSGANPTNTRYDSLSCWASRVFACLYACTLYIQQRKSASTQSGEALDFPNAVRMHYRTTVSWQSQQRLKYLMFGFCRLLPFDSLLSYSRRRIRMSSYFR